MLSIIERSVPIERIWLDVSETEATAVTPMDANEIAQLSNQLLELGKALPASMTPDQRANMLLVSLPGDLTELRAELVRRMREAT
ncbi:hypothetical protein FNL55_07200 [Tardiphaga sp. vice352]|nr:hypothetical protein [Tardiphaga sp. vice352]QDM31120.1 hypothetical protein FNL55_07200 [Tardiphaga sp. vice352]